MALLALQTAVAGGVCLLVLLAYRWVHRRSQAIAHLMAAGVILRAGFGVALFWISYLNLPILRSMQLGEGFWSLMGDARGYYRYAVIAIENGLATIVPGLSSPFFTKTLAVWMRLVGVSPAAGILLNISLCVGLTMALVGVFRPVNDWRRDLPCTVAVGSFFFSPVSLLNGTQALKDDLFNTLIGLACIATFGLLEPLVYGNTRKTTSSIGFVMALLLAVACISGIRAYYAAIVLATLACILGLFFFRQTFRRMPLYALSAVIVLALGGAAYSEGAGPYYRGPSREDFRSLQSIKSFSGGSPSAVFKQLMAIVDMARTGFTLTGGATNITPTGTVATLAPPPDMPAPPPLTPLPALPPVDEAPPVAVTSAAASPPGRLQLMVLGMAIVFVPISLLKSLAIVSFAGGRGLLPIADIDTVFFDLSFVMMATMLLWRRKEIGRRLPYLAFCVLLTSVTAVLLGYVVTNFGSLLRMRSIVAAPFWMAALALGRVRPSTVEAAKEERNPSTLLTPAGLEPIRSPEAKFNLFSILRCPSCRSVLSLAGTPSSGQRLCCGHCGLEAPLLNGIPRFVAPNVDTHASGSVAQRTRESFGYEWTHFNDWKPSGTVNFADYFAGLDLESLRGQVVLDGGCGMGRHARQIAPFAGAVIAVDFSDAIEQAARNTSDQPNLQCVQGDLMRLPLGDAEFDFVYSMGVLHHLEETQAALRELLRTLKPGGRLRIYLYWKRTGISGLLLHLVSAIRRITTRLPFRLLRALCWVLSVVLFVVVIAPYKALAAVGITSESWPLVVYAKYPFAVLYNDQFDRFSAPLEKRYSDVEVRDLLRSVGLRDVTVYGRFGWIGEGTK